MTGKECLNHVARGAVDVVDLVLAMCRETESGYCAIGGLAVNAYAEPVVSLDLDLVVVSDRVEPLIRAAAAAGMKVQRFEHSVILSISGSDLRVQLQTDARYQELLARAEIREVLGYQMSVACVEDVLQGKLWAYLDANRRGSKRQKDLADILRLVETHPELESILPAAIRSLID